MIYIYCGFIDVFIGGVANISAAAVHCYILHNTILCYNTGSGSGSRAAHKALKAYLVKPWLNTKTGTSGGGLRPSPL